MKAQNNRFGQKIFRIIGHSFTLIEIVAVIIISSLMLLFGMMFVVPMTEGYLTNQKIVGRSLEASLIVNRVVKEIKNIGTVVEIPDPSTIRFSGPNTTIELFAWHPDKTLKIDDVILSKEVNSFSAMKDINGAIVIDFTLVDLPSYPINIVVDPRN